MGATKTPILGGIRTHLPGPMRATVTRRPAPVPNLHDAAGLTDEALRVLSAARVLITARTERQVESAALRIHSASRAEAPFVQLPAATLPGTAEGLASTCHSLLEWASGGSLLITGIEEMPGGIQDAFVNVLDTRQSVCTGPMAVRLMSGTTVSLKARVDAGRFSNRLFYWLNMIHVKIPTPE